MPINPKCGVCVPQIEICDMVASVMPRNAQVTVDRPQDCSVKVTFGFCIAGMKCSPTGVPIAPFRPWTPAGVGSSPGSIPLGNPHQPGGSLLSLGAHYNQVAGGGNRDDYAFTPPVCCDGIKNPPAGQGGTPPTGPMCQDCCIFLYEQMKKRLRAGGGEGYLKKGCTKKDFATVPIPGSPVLPNLADVKICKMCEVIIRGVPCDVLELDDAGWNFQKWVTSNLENIGIAVMEELRTCIKGIFDTPAVDMWQNGNITVPRPRTNIRDLIMDTGQRDRKYWLTCIDCPAACC